MAGMTTLERSPSLASIVTLGHRAEDPGALHAKLSAVRAAYPPPHAASSRSTSASRRLSR